MKKTLRIVGIVAGAIAVVSAVIVGWLYFEEICEFVKNKIGKCKCKDC